MQRALRKSTMEAFNKSMSDLFKVCENIQRAKELTNLKLNLEKRVNPITKYFSKYVAVYRKTEPDEHVPDVVAMFKRHRHSILKGDDDTWLKEKSVTLQYGDGLKETKDIKIMLSSFYTSGLQVKEAVEKQLEGLSQEAYEDRVELIYCDVMRLHLYRLMYEAVEAGPDKEALGKIVKNIEKELGLESSETVDTTPDFNLGSILGEAAKIAQKQGIVGPGAKMPSQEELTKVIGGLFNSPAIKETFGSLLGGLKDAQSPEQLIGKLSESLKKIGPDLQGITGSLAPPPAEEAAAATATSTTSAIEAVLTDKPLLEM